MPVNHPSILAQVLERWNAAGRRWDPSAFTDCFADDGLFYGGRPAHSVGRDAIRAYFDSYVGVIDVCQLVLRDQEFVEAGAGFLLAQGWGEFSFVLADGQRTTSTVRTTWLLQQLPGGEWKIRQQHFAPPPAEPPLGR
jgi:uncharacterized protein (TIGR02246 family)